MNTKKFFGILFSFVIVACGPITEKGDGPDQATPVATRYVVEFSTDSTTPTFVTLSKAQDCALATRVSTEGQVLDAHHPVIYPAGVTEGECLAFQVAESESVLIDWCIASRPIRFFVSLNGGAVVSATGCTVIGETSYITGKVVDGEFLPVGGTLRYASGPTTPPSCEERGDCPPPSTCEERGDCEEEPIHVPVDSDGAQVYIELTTPGFSNGVVYTAQVSYLWDDSGTLYLTENPSPRHDPAMHEWSVVVSRATRYRVTEGYLLKTNIDFGLGGDGKPDWYCDSAGMDTSKGSIQIKATSLDGSVSRTFTVSTNTHREDNGQDGCDVIWGVQIIRNSSGVLTDIRILQWDASSGVIRRVS